MEESYFSASSFSAVCWYGHLQGCTMNWGVCKHRWGRGRDVELTGRDLSLAPEKTSCEVAVRTPVIQSREGNVLGYSSCCPHQVPSLHHGPGRALCTWGFLCQQLYRSKGPRSCVCRGVDGLDSPGPLCAQNFPSLSIRESHLLISPAEFVFTRSSWPGYPCESAECQLNDSLIVAGVCLSLLGSQPSWPWQLGEQGGPEGAELVGAPALHWGWGPVLGSGLCCFAAAAADCFPSAGATFP